jgi:phospholipid/cholesterol/gamma-HCH transport system substrate-binding protein
MKISNETKVGVLTIIAVTLLILGFNFLKGKELFNKQKKLYAVFTNLGSLQKSNEVRINGLPVGIVYNYVEKDKQLSGIVVTINMKRDVNIPDNSIATIESELIGSSYINITFGNSNSYLENGDTVHTDLSASLLSDVKAQLNPTLGKTREAIDSLKLVLGSINRFLNSEMKGGLLHVIQNLETSTASLSSLLNTQGGPLSNSLANIESISGNLKNNNDSITQTISTIRRAANKFTEIEVQATIDEMKASITLLKEKIEKINLTDGTLGKLMNSDELYKQLMKNMNSLETLTDDLRINPKRYTGNIIFNRRDRTGPLTSPVPRVDSASNKDNQ